MQANHLSTADCRSLLFFMLVLLLGGEFRSDAANTADQVASSAQEARPIAVGAAAPDAALRDLDGNDVTLHAIVAEKPTVLIFYRGSWCPYCNLQLSDLVKVEEELSLASSTCPAVGFGLTQDATSHASHCSARRLLNNLRQIWNKFLQFNRNGNYPYRRSEQAMARFFGAV